MTTTATDLTIHHEAVTAAVAEARGELCRADTKASALMGLAMSALAGLIVFVQAGHVPRGAVILLWISAALTGAAIVPLLAVIRANLGATEIGAMLADHCDLLTAEDIHEWQRRRLEIFSPAAAAKHRLINRSVDLMRAALAALGAAVAVTAITAAVTAL